MSVRKKYFLIFLILILVGSCGKKWKKPTKVSVQYYINNKTGSNNIEFTGGFIVLSAFEFEGDRKQADDQYFEKEFPQGLHINFQQELTVAEMEFDIPQGTYTDIVLAFETYDVNDTSSIYVEGIYTNDNGDKIPVAFDFWDSEYFSVTARAKEGDNEIIFDHNKPLCAKIELDPVVWFSGISKTILDNANLININGSQTIYISGKYNTDIYEIVVSQLDKSTEAIFEFK